MGRDKETAALHDDREERISPTVAGIVLIVLIVAHGAVNTFVVFGDRVPLYKDLAHNAHMGLRWHDALFEGASPQKLFQLTSYPPLYFVSTVPFYAAIGLCQEAAAMPNTLFLALLLVATYRIGRHFHSRGAGLLAAALLSLFPQVFGQARSQMIDLSLTATLALSVWLMLETDLLRRPGRSILWGIAMGLGMLAKWTFPIYMAGPWC